MNIIEFIRSLFKRNHNISTDYHLPDKLPSETIREALKRNMAEGYLSKGEKKLIDDVCDKALAYDKITTPHSKEEYYNNKYPTQVIYYKGRSIPNHGSYSTDIRGFFINPISNELRKIAIGWNGKIDDAKALACQKFVKNVVTYVSDKSSVGLNEYWQYPQETLYLLKGDCDDGSILMANLMLASGIPYWKVRLNAGNVYDLNGEYLGGHAWLNYYYEKEDKWISMDWCFYPKLSPLKDRPDYKDEVIYGKGNVWFSWNQKYAFAKSTSKIKPSLDRLRIRVENERNYRTNKK